MRMLHPDGPAPARPVDVPILVGALGPKGHSVARELGDGLYVTLALPEFMTEYSWVPYLVWGTVLGDGEAVDDERVRLAGGPGWALAYHGAYEFGGPDAVRALPGGAEWMAVVEEAPDELRHLSVHAGHCVELGRADTAAWQAGGHKILPEVTVSGTAAQVRRKLDEAVDAGVTEIVFQPCGPGTRGELERFLAAATA
ncbi:hypothetical protein L3X23_19850 [Pseudonocardia sp. WMMC193]|nr:hypothetical protein [Pseudonocardia sp. WMMC193]